MKFLQHFDRRGAVAAAVVDQDNVALAVKLGHLNGNSGRVVPVTRIKVHVDVQVSQLLGLQKGQGVVFRVAGRDPEQPGVVVGPWHA